MTYMAGYQVKLIVALLFIHTCAAVTYCILNKPDEQSLQYSHNPLHKPRWEWIAVPI